MTSEQLQSARAERWRQKSNPAFTAEDAKAWVEGIGLCLFLPRRGHFPVAAPSFAEAVMGAPSEAPGREALEMATTLMRQLAEESAVVPLNLFGTTWGPASDQPDFLCSRAVLPYVFSLIGGRNWKSGPGGKASVLMTDVWTLLNDGEARTVAEIQATLGRELTEAAVLRGLVELWHGLRAIPVYDGDVKHASDVTRWELTQARFAAEMTESQKVAQTTALSALVSLYLDGAVAASSEDIETFLSPLTARSRVREVVNGLAATRQLGLVSVGARPLLHVAGALPELKEEEAAGVGAEASRAREIRAERKGYERRPPPERAGAEERGGKGGFPDQRERPFPRREFEERRQRPFARRERPGDQRSFAKERSGEWREGPSEGGGGFRKRERAGHPKRGERSAEGGFNFPKRKFGEERERPRRGSEERPWQKREERPWQKREARPAARAEGKRPFGERREDERRGGKKPFRSGKRFDGGKFGGRESGGREKPRIYPKSSGDPEGRTERGGATKKFAPKKFGEFGGREKPRFVRGRAGEGEGRPERERGAGKFGVGKKFGGKKFGFRKKSVDRRLGGQGKPRVFRERAGGGEGRTERERGSGTPGAERGKTGFGNSGRPAFRGEGKRSFSKERKRFGKPGGNFANRPGKSGFGKANPGGFKPPFRKRRKQEGEE